MRRRIFLMLGLCSAFFAGLRSTQAQWDSSAQTHRVPLLNHYAQEMEEAPGQFGAPMADDAGLLRLDVTVHDSKGSPVSGLAASDFKLLENDKPNKILSFEAIEAGAGSAEPPVEVILLLDTIGLSNAQSSVQEREVSKFLRQKAGRLAHPVSLFWLAASGLWSPPQAQLSVDGNGLATALEHKSKLHSVWSIKDAPFSGHSF